MLSRVPGILFFSLHTFRIPRRDQALVGDFEWSPFQLKDSDLVAIAANEGGSLVLAITTKTSLLANLESGRVGVVLFYLYKARTVF